jgi:hypothetical protein
MAILPGTPRPSLEGAALKATPARTTASIKSTVGSGMLAGRITAPASGELPGSAAATGPMT